MCLGCTFDLRVSLLAMSSLHSLKLACLLSHTTIQQDVDQVASAMFFSDYWATRCAELTEVNHHEIESACQDRSAKTNACWPEWRYYPRKNQLCDCLQLSALLMSYHPFGRAAGYENTTEGHREFFRLVSLRRILRLLESEMVHVQLTADSHAVDVACDAMELESDLR